MSRLLCAEGVRSRAERIDSPDATPVSASRLCHRILNLEQNPVHIRMAAHAHILEQHAPYESSWKAALLKTDPMNFNADRLLSCLSAMALQWDAHAATHALVLDGPGVQFVLAQYAPQGLLGGCILQNMAHAANCHEPIAVLAHAMHSWHVADGSPAHNHSMLYRQWLEQCGHALPAIDSSTFSERAGLLASAWDVAAYRLSLSLFPKTHALEILGAALFELDLPVPPIIAALCTNGHARDSAYLEACHAPTRKQALANAAQAIGLALEQASVSDNNAAARVACGYLVSLHLTQAWQAELERHVRFRLSDSEHAMVELIRRKGRHAVGYHGRLKLGSRAFDEVVVNDPEQFVRDLARSRWIVPGHPEQSLLLTRLIAFGGPMFRVFSDAEIAVIEAWIAALGATCNERSASAAAHAGDDGADVAAALPHAEPCGEDERRNSTLRCRFGARDLYHRLLNLEDYPDTIDDARAFAETWLARAARKLDRASDPLPFRDYSHERLRDWFEERALAQAQSYAGPSEEVAKSREDVIDEATQLCPMIFIDGGWIQRWANAGLVETRIGALLYKIFSDEIGNGDTRLNHPNIYRDLMQQMNVPLPDFRTQEFASSRLFGDLSFEVPAFWLSLSQFPRRFLPETLGLNLAMELSGVGGAYRTARDELRHYGFNTLFVDLHNTIDNVSSGHSAMAMQAIEIYMDEVLCACDREMAAMHWRRVWTGFRALSIPKRSWKEMLAAPRYETCQAYA